MTKTAVSLLADSSDDDDNANFRNRKKQRRETSTGGDSDVLILRDTADSDVEDISPGTFKRAMQAKEAEEDKMRAKGAGGKEGCRDDEGVDDDEQGDGVRITASFGKVATRDMPHSRPDCAVHHFTFGTAASNARHCAQCYCYVCDVKASECQFWGTGAGPDDHANARPLAAWNRMRRAVRQGVALPPPAAAAAAANKNKRKRDSTAGKTVPAASRRPAERPLPAAAAAPAQQPRQHQQHPPAPKKHRKPSPPPKKQGREKEARQRQQQPRPRSSPSRQPPPSLQRLLDPVQLEAFHALAAAEMMLATARQPAERPLPAVAAAPPQQPRQQQHRLAQQAPTPPPHMPKKQGAEKEARRKQPQPRPGSSPLRQPPPSLQGLPDQLHLKAKVRLAPAAGLKRTTLKEKAEQLLKKQQALGQAQRARLAALGSPGGSGTGSNGVR